MKYPDWSTMAWVSPLLLLKAATWPLAPTLTTARFEAVSPATKLTFDAVGAASSAGYAVSTPAAVGAVTVRFSTAAVGRGHSTPQPVSLFTATDACWYLPSLPGKTPSQPEPSRVSAIRVGPYGT